MPLENERNPMPVYVMEFFGDLPVMRIECRNRLAFATLDEALDYLVKIFPCEYRDDEGIVTGVPDPEDDRILIWEVDPKADPTIKIAWHFSGWHWDSDEIGGLEQGKLPGHEQSLYKIASNE